MTSEYITQIKTENEALKKRVFELEESLKKYTSTHRQKKYYEKNADDVIQKNYIYSIV
jgi:cell division septum initiation protein DivIVA